MSHSVPTLRQHTRGYWFVRWGGKDHYLSANKATAKMLFEDPSGEHPGSLVRWLADRELKARMKRAKQSQDRFVVDVAEEFLEHYLRDGRVQPMKYHRKHLTRFLSVLGTVKIHQIDVPALIAWRDDLMRLDLAPKTLAHDIGAVKTFFNWASENQHGPMLNLKAIKKPFIPPPVVKRLTFQQVASMVRTAYASDPNLAAHIALNYLCLMRPSEVIRFVNGEGHFNPVVITRRGRVVYKNDAELVEPRGVFQLDRSKTERRSSYPRTVVVTDQALAWLSIARPVFTHESPTRALDKYSKAVRKVCGPGGPKILQKSAVWHLQLAGVEEGETDQLLGHGPSASWRSYGLRVWSILRETASRISV